MSVVATDTLGQARFWSTRQDQAHRRYTAALNQLTTIRRLPLSTAQASTESAESMESSDESMASAEQANPAAEQGATNGNGQQHGDLPTKAAGTQDTGTHGAASGNGKAPSQVPEDNGRVNGQPVNRILRFADPVVKV